ncbi:MAG: D-glucuronyl C5-epimerase family protein [Lentimicrobiaceae bacterium]|nr:D-glucuronyl C5-epimerase family protein [Lentimicrobiaceae bacterium]
MGIIKKIKYGISRAIAELKGENDYWHPRLKPLDKTECSNDIYFLDMSPKADYYGEMEGAVPIFYLNGKYPVFFYITILNYGLGLLNKKKKGINVDEEIINTLKFILDKQNDDGEWVYTFPDGAVHKLNNKSSGMTQGLAISFIIRCYYLGFLDYELCIDRIKKAKNAMLSKKHISIYNNCEIIEEFYTPGDTPLNGAIFALFGLYDYCKFISDMSEFNKFNNDYKKHVHNYEFYKWSYYDVKKNICSCFYHQLHIDLLNALFILTGDMVYKRISKKWEKGLKYKYVFIILKSFQKITNIKSMTMSYDKLQK